MKNCVCGSGSASARFVVSFKKSDGGCMEWIPYENTNVNGECNGQDGMDYGNSNSVGQDMQNFHYESSFLS